MSSQQSLPGDGNLEGRVLVSCVFVCGVAAVVAANVADEISS